VQCLVYLHTYRFRRYTKLLYDCARSWLLAAVQIHWNSSLIMLRRLAKEDVWKSVIDILGRAKSTTGSGHVPRMTATQSQVQDLVSILEYFKEATNVLQGDGITSSMIIPAILGVDTSLADSSTG